MPEKDAKEKVEPTDEESGETTSTEPTGETKKIIVEHIFKDERKKTEKPEGEDKTAPIEGETGEEGGEKPPKPEVTEPPTSEKTETPPIGDKEGKGDKDKTDREKELETQLEEREAQLAALALKEFDDEKVKLLGVIKDDKKKKFVEDFIGDDPEKLEQVKFMTGLLAESLGEGGVTVTGEDKTGEGEGDGEKEGGEGDGTEPVPPKGVVKKPPKSAGVNVDGRQIISDLYNILADPSKTKAEKDIAEKKINELFGQFVQGSKDTNRIVPIKVLNCPQCGNVMEGNTCQHCGYVMPAWESKPPRI